MCNLAVAIRYQHQAFLLKLLKNRPADDEIFESLEIAVLIISTYKTEHFKWNTTLKLLYIRYWLRKGISLSINFDYQFLIFNMYKQIQKWIFCITIYLIRTRLGILRKVFCWYNTVQKTQSFCFDNPVNFRILNYSSEGHIFRFWHKYTN